VPLTQDRYKTRYVSELFKVWQAPTTVPSDRKELLRTLLEEVIIALDKEQNSAGRNVIDQPIDLVA
jgi:hypothetical protein